MSSANFCTLSGAKKSRPLRPKNREASGCRTSLKRPGRARSRAVSVAAASEAWSGVGASTTTASRSMFCGNSRSRSAVAFLQGRFDEISFCSSVSIEIWRAV